MSSGAVLRVEWLPGTDHLLGTCHCGASYRGQDPVEAWDWLHAHPGHPAHADPADPADPTDPADHGRSDHPALDEDHTSDR
jgi:hypothetical protein